MSHSLRPACAGLFAASVLTACAMQNANVPPDELMRQLQAGQPMLDCTLNCSGAWGANRQRVKTLDATGQWKDLA
jgi:TctA family transporter